MKKLKFICAVLSLTLLTLNSFADIKRVRGKRSMEQSGENTIIHCTGSDGTCMVIYGIRVTTYDESGKPDGEYVIEGYNEESCGEDCTIVTLYGAEEI